MAGSLSGRFTKTLSGYKLHLDWEITSQGLDGNNNPYSVVKITYKIERRSTNWNSWNMNNTSKVTLVVGGTTIVNEEILNFDTRNYTVDTEYSVWSKSTTVYHGSTGSKTVSISFTHKSVTSGIGTETWGGNAVLLDIPMAGVLSLSANAATIANASGASITASIGTFISAYYYKILWKIGTTTVETSYPTAASEAHSLAAATWGAAMPSSSSSAVTCELYTYSDSSRTQLIGSTSATFTLNFTAPPTMTSATAAPRGAAYNAGITGYYYSGYSTALITGNGAAGVYGSTISSYLFYQAGTLQDTKTTNTWTSGTLTAGNIVFKVRAVDSRGNYVEKSVTISVLTYGAPSITSYDVYRCDSGGAAVSSGTRLYASATAVAEGSGNAIVSIVVKVYSAGGLLLETKDITSGGQVLDETYAASSRFSAVITAVDKLGTQGPATVQISTDSRIINIHIGGDGIAFGEFAEADTMSTFWPLLLRKGIKLGSAITVASSADLESRIASAMNDMVDNSVQMLLFLASSNISPFGYAYFAIQILKFGTGYAALHAYQYQSTTGAKEYTASVYNGSLTGWASV